MAEIIPFRGTRYDPALAGSADRLIAPPYDVITPDMRDALTHISQYNIARIIKADREPTDTPYAQAARIWQAWQKDGIVRRDDQPAIYVYEQHFEIKGHKFSRTGMICLTRIRELGDGVYPHEHTLTGPRADRLQLLRASKTHFGLVFALYPDPQKQIDNILNQAKTAEPITQAADRDNQLHRLWAITNTDTITHIQRLMREKHLLIADGHHRYETALAFRNENPQWEPAQYRMMALVNTANVGLVVLPTHRLVKNIPGFDPATFLARLRKHCQIKPYPGRGKAARTAVITAIRDYANQGRHACGLVLSDGKHYLLLLRSTEAMNDIAGHSEEWRNLDVAILHHLILEQTLGITPEQILEQTHIEYIHDFPHEIETAAKRVLAGKADACFLLNPTRINQVLAVAQNNERMPQKSTFFYPKVYTGLVFNCLESRD